jgi:hypothetical protein
MMENDELAAFITLFTWDWTTTNYKIQDHPKSNHKSSFI